MREDKFILVDGKPVPEPDTLKWARWFETAKRRVAHTVIGDSEISTVFLGLNHNFSDGPPLLYETMVFGGKLSNEEDRYSTQEEAERGHEAMCARVRSEG